MLLNNTEIVFASGLRTTLEVKTAGIYGETHYYFLWVGRNDTTTRCEATVVTSTGLFAEALQEQLLMRLNRQEAPGWARIILTVGGIPMARLVNMSMGEAIQVIRWRIARM
jgi:hypothetical protein